MKRISLIFLLFLAALPATAQTTITLSPATPAPGQTVTATVRGRWPDSCTPTLKEARVVDRTVIIEGEITGCELRLCAAVATDYTLTTTFTAPGGTAPFDIEYYVNVCGTNRKLIATTTASLFGVCDFGHALTVTPSGVRVGDQIVLRWCNPSRTQPDNTFTVTGYRIYVSKSETGPFTKLMDVAGAATDSIQFTATTSDIGTNYFMVEAIGCTTTITGECVPTTLLTNIATVSVSATTGCAPNATTLCLGNGRFELTGRWRANGQNGDARPVQLTADSGYFWFFDEDNVEVTVKVLNACSLAPGAYWVFASGMTNVEVELTVLDTLRNTTKTYSNPAGTTFVTKLDTNAFACP